MNVVPLAENGLLVALLAAWAVLLFGGFLVGQPHDSGKRRMPTWMRMASSFTLVAAAWVGFLLLRDTRPGAALLVAVGMTLGFIGDLFMAGLIPVGNRVLGGIASFGLGHIAYMLAFLQTGAGQALQDDGGRVLALLVWWLVGAVGWYGVVFRGQKPTPLHLAALPYALLLASTAGLATVLALGAPGLFLLLAVGAGLFLLSDLILAAELFNGLHFPLIGDVVWLTYGPAQMLIVYSMIGGLLAAA